MLQRHEIAQNAAGKLAAADLSPVYAVLGFDGFVDQIIDVVARRSSHDQYERLATIAQFGERVSRAAGKSSNFELVVKHRRLGGNGPIMGHALARLGFAVDYIGTVGAPADSMGSAAVPLDPVFHEFAKLAKLHGLAPPAHTNALEFVDGKVMLGDLASLSQVTWECLLAHVGLERFQALCERASLVGMVNWTMLPHLTSIWQHAAAEVFPSLSAKPRRVFVDIADPEKRDPADLRKSLRVLAQLDTRGNQNGSTRVTLGLNLSEALQVAKALEIPAEPEDSTDEIVALAMQIRKDLGIATVVIHPRNGAAAATPTGAAAIVRPVKRHPAVSTGAGDHFNAGFTAGELLEFSLEESLCLGTALSGYFVRHAQSPTKTQLVEFLMKLPAPEA